jgi:quercetin dioxygenase-like cupin family protein
VAARTTIAAVVAAAAVGAAVALVAGRDGADRQALRGGGVLASLPDGPVHVVAESVRLPDGFRSRHRHGGPTFTIVVSGEVEIHDDGGTKRYRPEELFFKPAGRVHELRVLADARLDVIRLLPPGAAATTEVE